jgi:RNA polymerase sigma-70 factor, ECF subfamily
LAFAHFGELRRVALRVCEDRETADDLVQETYLRAWRSFDKFETSYRAYQVASVDKGIHRIFVVSDLSDTENIVFAKRVFPGTISFIRKMEHAGV